MWNPFSFLNSTVNCTKEAQPNEDTVENEEFNPIDKFVGRDSLLFYLSLNSNVCIYEVKPFKYDGAIEIYMYFMEGTYGVDLSKPGMTIKWKDTIEQFLKMLKVLPHDKLKSNEEIVAIELLDYIAIRQRGIDGIIKRVSEMPAYDKAFDLIYNSETSNNAIHIQSLEGHDIALKFTRKDSRGLRLSSVIVNSTEYDFDCRQATTTTNTIKGDSMKYMVDIYFPCEIITGKKVIAGIGYSDGNVPTFILGNDITGEYYGIYNGVRRPLYYNALDNMWTRTREAIWKLTDKEKDDEDMKELTEKKHLIGEYYDLELTFDENNVLATVNNGMHIYDFKNKEKIGVYDDGRDPDVYSIKFPYYITNTLFGKTAIRIGYSIGNIPTIVIGDANTDKVSVSYNGADLIEIKYDDYNNGAIVRAKELTDTLLSQDIIGGEPKNSIPEETKKSITKTTPNYLLKIYLLLQKLNENTAKQNALNLENAEPISGKYDKDSITKEIPNYLEKIYDLLEKQNAEKEKDKQIKLYIKNIENGEPIKFPEDEKDHVLDTPKCRTGISDIDITWTWDAENYCFVSNNYKNEVGYEFFFILEVPVPSSFRYCLMVSTSEGFDTLNSKDNIASVIHTARDYIMMNYSVKANSPAGMQ